MGLQECYDKRDELLKQLGEVIQYKKKLSQQLPKAEKEYRQSMAIIQAKLNSGDYKNYGSVAWTATYNLAKGINADLMEKRDEKKYMMESTQEMIYFLKLQLKIVEADIYSIRNKDGL